MLAVLAVAALVGSGWIDLIFYAAVATLGFLRFRVWQAERIILTDKRIIHTHGILETTRTEASLRLDRVNGLRLIETLPGRILGYATISVEAPGDHPGLKRMYRMARLHPFYETLRNRVFGESVPPDPDEEPLEYVTDRLPVIEVERDRFGRRRW